MILVLAIILFIIYLIYSIKPRREEYTLEGLELSWKNKASIEGIVTKWIVTLKDSSGNVIHTYENNESKNLKDFTDVSMNIVDKKEFDEKIIGDNKLELYYNEVNSENKLYTKTVTFTEDDFGVSLDTSKLEEIEEPEISPPPPPITEIPHQIPSAAPGGWCNHANAVHQDVPGCGRICSDSNTVGRKDKGTWGSWNAYPGSVDCPAAKLDQVWKMEGDSRKLAVGNYSEAKDMTGGFKWYYYQGSYFSAPSSFNNKTPKKTGTGVTDFSNINKATNGVLTVNGKNNYAVRWQGRFVPKKDGSHKFWTKSDDMSYLYVNNDKVVDNGGLHGMDRCDNCNPKYNPDNYGTVIMEKGREYLIEIFFSEKSGGDNIIVNFEEPNGTKTTNFSGYMVR